MLSKHSNIVVGAPTETWKKWHRAIEAAFDGDHAKAQTLLDELFSDDIVFKPPTYFKERKSKPFAMMALKGVSTLFKDFKYTREFVAEREMALEFIGRCGENGPVIQGIDMIKVDENGKIVEFAVLARPPTAVQAILEHQSKFMAEFLKNAKL